MTRLFRKKGQVALVKWRDIAIKFVVTPAGLLDIAGVEADPQLTLEVTQQSPLDIMQALLKGDKPEIRKSLLREIPCVCGKGRAR